MTFLSALTRSLWLSLFIFMSSATAGEFDFFVTNERGEALEAAVIEPISESPVIADSQPVAVIDQVNKRFKPAQLLITTGQDVDFPNSDNIRHHVYSFSEAKTFELKLYADTPEQPVNFPEHGVVVLGCNIHDTMIGYIFVSNHPDTISTNETGQATLNTEANMTSVRVWHKHQSQGPEKLKQVALDTLSKDEMGRYQIRIATTAPEPTNSFEDTFRGISAAD
jgi:plastocyanin